MPGNSRSSADGSRVVRWLLRITVVAMCIGQAWWLAMVQETPLVSWLHSPHDVGGWNLSEPFALRTQTAAACLLTVTAGVTCFRSVGFLLVPLALLQITFAVAMWQMGEGFQLVVAWLSPTIAGLLPFLTQGGRIAAPVALWLYDKPGGTRSWTWEAVARWGTCLAFAGHGLEALWHAPSFIDLILYTAHCWNLNVTEATANRLLTFIGCVDLLLATLVVSTRWRTVAIYAAFWGLVTAASRITAYGPEMGWYETLMRSAHFGLPAALAVYWWDRQTATLVSAADVSAPE